MSSQLFNSRPLLISEVNEFKNSIETWFDMIGFRDEDWVFIGSFGKKEMMGDVDIAVFESSKANIDEWEDLFFRLGYDYKIFKGFNQISFGFPFKGEIIQVDLMLTKDLSWSEFIYYSPNLSSLESKFKGIYRNLLLSSLIITESRTEFKNSDIGQYILRLNEGLIWVVKTFRNEGGKITKKSRIIEEKCHTNDPSRLCEIFELQEPILTFEQLWNQVKVRNKKLEIQERFEKFCKQHELEIPKYGEI